MTTDTRSKLTELTPEQKAMMPVVRDYWIDLAIGGNTSIDEAAIKEGFKFVYSLMNVDPPEIEICDSPYQAVENARAQGAQVTNTTNLGLGYDSGWMSFYDYFRKINHEGRPVLEDENFDKLCLLMEAGLWDCVCCEPKVFVSKRPNLVSKDSEDRLHNEDGPAVRFDDGFAIYAWHGTVVPEQVIEDPESFTKEQIDQIDNSEVIRALAEKLGWDRFLEKRETKVIDSWKDPGTGLQYELLDLKQRDGDGQPRFLRMRSPTVKDGSNPWYIEPVPPTITSAQAARAWQFPKENGEWPEVDEVNKNPNYRFDLET